MDKQILLIDGNNLYRRGYGIIKKVNSELFHFVCNMIQNLKRDFAKSRLIFFFDTCKSSMKLALYPEYKGHREKKSLMTPEEYAQSKNQLNEIIFLLKNSGVVVIEGDGYEADDYIAVFARMLKPQFRIIISSNDNDFCQILTENVVIYNPIKHVYITHKNFKNIFGIEVENYLDYKCIVGDDSDNIKGVEGVGEKTAIKWLNEYGSYYSICGEFAKKKKLLKREQSLLASHKLYERNKQLMDMRVFYQDKVIRKLIKIKCDQIRLDEDKIMEILARNECTKFFNLFAKIRMIKC